jgi:hypothetical protein
MTIGLKRFSSRTSVLTGGTLTVISYIITAYTTDIRVFYFAQGVLGGKFRYPCNFLEYFNSESPKKAQHSKIKKGCRLGLIA